MSKYLVDKFLYKVDRNEDQRKRYMADPKGFVAWWEKEEVHRLNDAETTSGHDFTPEERKALEDVDFEKLYAMGAHPFVLWTLMLPIYQSEFAKVPDLMAHYRERIAPYGRPDWTT